jgi:hypothetical protein
VPAGDWGDVRDTDEPIEEFENRPPRRLDRNNVPAEITPEMIDRLSFGDIRWLRTEANLTPEQRQSFDAAYQASSLGQLFAESGGRFREIWKQFQLDRKRGDQIMRDRIATTLTDLSTQAERVRETNGPLNELGPEFEPPAFVPRAVRQERLLSQQAKLAEQQAKSLAVLVEMTARMGDAIAVLAERTEQQERVAARQKTTNLALAVIAVASMAGTFAVVDSVQNFWFALIATFGGAGVLYVLMIESPRA